MGVVYSAGTLLALGVADWMSNVGGWSRHAVALDRVSWPNRVHCINTRFNRTIQIQSVWCILSFGENFFYRK